MYGSAFYNPFMYQPYYQAARMAGNGLGGLAGAATSNLGRAGLSNLGRAAAGTTAASRLGRGLLSRFSFSSFLNGASKTLNVVNQAIPIFYQIKPMINNAKTMFRIMGAVKEDDNPKTQGRTKNVISKTNQQVKNNQPMKTTLLEEANDSDQTENPTFFI